MRKWLPAVSYILLIYEHTLKEIGVEKFCEFCKTNGFRDIILAGQKGAEIKRALMVRGLRVSCYIQYFLPAGDVASARESNGFVYLQAKPTAGRINPEYPRLSDCIRYLRGAGIVTPVYCGVGINEPKDVCFAKKAGADGVFVGSALLKLSDDRAALIRRIREFKAVC
jgi:tryptophan synthase alpha chain